MSRSNNFLNNHANYGANISQAYTHTVMPSAYPTGHTRYDINLGGMEDSTNPAILLIDSADRNHDVYEQPNKYTLKLDPPYKEVTSIELVTADIPNSGYVVEDTHNKIHFQDTADQVANGTYYTAIVPEGNWTIDDSSDPSIRSHIEDQMNAESSGSTYTVTVNSFTNKVTITQTIGSGIFNLLFEGASEKIGPPAHKDGVYIGESRTLYRETTIAPLIGFKRMDYTGETTYTGTYSYNLKVDKYIVLFVNKKHNNAKLDRVHSVNDYTKDAFCIVPLDSSINNFKLSKDCNSIDNDRYIKYFTEPIPEINELDIEFRDASGNLFNFNGHDHTLIFEIKSNTRRSAFSESRKVGR